MTLFFIFHKGDIMLHKNGGGGYDIPMGGVPPAGMVPDVEAITLSTDGGEMVAFETDYPRNDDEYEMCNLRQAYYKLDHDLYAKAGKCYELVYWSRNNRYCGICGGGMRMHTEISKCCEKCGNEVWPLLSTAIIVLIEKGNEALLVRANNFKRNFYGLVAGFVETGETLEEAVIREVSEETSIEIDDIRYYASQPWPFPCGLMVGFFARYKSGEIRLQHDELADGGWFSRDNLPTLPDEMSIARRLIETWRGKKKTKSEK